VVEIQNKLIMAVMHVYDDCSAIHASISEGKTIVFELQRETLSPDFVIIGFSVMPPV
jgi:hypothetical protein